jgi:phosphoglycolate phosphatase
MIIDTLLIDLDGTLTDPEIGIGRCIRYAMAKLGQPLAAELTLDWCIGPPLKNSFMQLLESQDEALAEQAVGHYRERFAELGLYENRVYPDVLETLAALQQRGYRLVLATAKPLVYAQIIMQHFQLTSRA